MMNEASVRVCVSEEISSPVSSSLSTEGLDFSWPLLALIVMEGISMAKVCPVLAFACSVRAKAAKLSRLKLLPARIDSRMVVAST